MGEHIKVCGAKFHVSQEEAQQFMAGDFSNQSKSFQCFTKCVLKQSDVLTPKGDYDEQTTLYKLTLSGVDVDRVRFVFGSFLFVF